MDVFDLAAKITLDTSEFESGLNRLTNLLTGLGIGALMYKATEAVVGFGAAAVQTGMEFDKSMSQVAATMGKTVADMETDIGHASTSFGEFNGNLRDFAQFMGANTAFTATQAADALNYMALAGYNTQQSMDMLPNVLNMAAAGAMDLATASDMVTDTQTAFGITAERTTQMVDEMAKAASTGNTSVSQLGSAFLVVGGLAKELNGGMVKLDDGTEQAVDGIQELEIALTAMANAGIKGGAAGTHMRNMLMKLSSPTSAGTVALEEMGVAIFDTAGNMRSLADIFGDLQGALSKMTQEQRIQTISELFNARDLTSAQAILGAIEQDWDKIGASILQAEGAADKMAKTQLDNLAGDITYLQSAFEGFQISISDVAAPELREFVQFGTQSLSEFTDVMNTMSTLSEAGVDVGIAPLFDKIGEQIGEGMVLVRDKFLEYAPELAQALVNVVNFAVEFIPDTLSGLIDLIPTFINDLALPILEQAPTLLQTVIELITQLADGIAEQLPTLLPALSQIIVDIIGVITNPENITSMINAAVGLLQALAQGIIDSIPVLVNAIPDILIGLVNGLVDGIGIILDAVPDIYKALVQAFLDNSDEIMSGLFELWKTILTKLPELVGDLGSFIFEMFGLVGDFLKQAWEEKAPELLDMIRTFFTENLPKLATELFSKIPEFINGLMEFVTMILSALPEAIKIIGEILPEIITLLLEVFIMELPYILDGITQIIIAIAENLPALIEPLCLIIPTLVITLVDVLLQCSPMLFEAVAEILAILIVNIFNFWGAIISALPTFFTNLLTSLGKLFVDSINLVGEFFASLGTFLNEAWGGVLTTIYDTFAKIYDAYMTWLAGVILDVADFFVNLWDDITGFYDELMLEFAGWVIGIGDKFTEIVDKITEIIKGLIDDALTWGGDLIDNFVQGITDNDSLTDAVGDNGVAGTVRKFLHFSKPDEGPLSDFDTYAPDMMRLFAQGIKDNEGLITDAIDTAFDFGDAMNVGVTQNNMGTSLPGLITPTVTQPITIILEVDKQQFGKIVYNMNQAETQRVGVTLGKEAFA